MYPEIGKCLFLNSFILRRNELLNLKNKGIHHFQLKVEENALVDMK